MGINCRQEIKSHHESILMSRWWSRNKPGSLVSGIQKTVSMFLSSQEHAQAQCQAQYIKAKVNSSHHMKKAEEARKALRRSLNQVAAMEKDLEEGNREISELKTTWRRYERQAKEKAAQDPHIQLDEDQVRLPTGPGNLDNLENDRCQECGGSPDHPSMSESQLCLPRLLTTAAALLRAEGAGSAARGRAEPAGGEAALGAESREREAGVRPAQEEGDGGIDRHSTEEQQWQLRSSTSNTTGQRPSQ